MAKPRKPKNSEETKPENNSGPLIRHQKLCLSIDIDNRRIYGFTELEIVVPDIGFVGLHAENLGIVSVSVDGDLTEFEYYPRNQHLENEKSFDSVSSPSSAADAAGSVYLSSIEKELVPNLLINCCKAFKNGNEPLEQPFLENGAQLSAEDKDKDVEKDIDKDKDKDKDNDRENIRLVRIEYWVEKSEAGIHFNNHMAFTDNQIRRARCWFPCMDDGLQRCRYDLEFTVSQDLVAVSNGSLLYQVLSKDNPPRKTYVYQLDVPVNAQWISLAVGPFEIVADHQIGLISHMCFPDNLFKLKHTVDFFHSAFSCYKDYLSVDFPFGSYKQIFIEPEMAVSSACLGVSMCIFSSHLLFDEKIIDQTIDTRIKLAYALARQWFGIYITPEAPNDEWLLDGLAGFLTDLFIKKNLGNNEARYQRYKANCAVCKADDSGVTTLCSSSTSKDLYGTQRIGIYGKIRSWKSVAILQMLEKQMGPESFRKILQNIVSRAKDTTSTSQSLSTKEFRHLANKIGNLERPFLKEFFPRWVESCGCPVLRMGFSYNKRRNVVEMAVLRECTVALASGAENRDSDTGWPGMMSIRIYELDGVFDHPVLPMSGESWQLLEIQCHSKLAARRLQKTKKGSKPDGSDDNADIPALDARSSVESPLLWLRADPEMEYLAEVHFNQPIQMWINQLEKDRDVIAQAQAITTMETLPHLSFSVVNALNNFLTDSKAFWRVRIDAALAMAKTASEDTDWAGLLNLIKFFKNQRFDADTGLPKPNDFRDFPEYFVLEAIPHAVAMVRATDQKSPREAVEFVLQLLKYNDNNGNPYSDVFWLAALVQSVGELEFGQQSVLLLASLLKRIDRLLQFDRLMPSYNGILTISCIRTLTQIALKLSGFLSLDRVFELIRPYRNFNSLWQVGIEASRALLDLEYHCKGIDAAILLFIKYLEEEKSLRGQVKLAVHVMRLCQIMSRSDSDDYVKSDTLVALLLLLESHMAFNNICLRHYLFCILQVLAGRSSTLHGVPREYKTLPMGDTGTCSEQKKVLTTLIPEFIPPDPSSVSAMPMPSVPAILSWEPLDAPKLRPDNLAIPEVSREGGTIPEVAHKLGMAVVEAPREAVSVSNSHERKMPVVKIKVRSSAATSRAEADNQTIERSHQAPHETDHGASSSVSVDAPQRNVAEGMSISNQNLEEVNSCHNHGSHMTASIGSAKLASYGDDLGKDFQCTADSSRAFGQFQPEDPSSSSIIQDNNIDADAQKYASLQTLSLPKHDHGLSSSQTRHGKKEKKKDKDKKRKRESHKEHRNDPEYIEQKRLKKEKKQKEKEMAKLLNVDTKPLPLVIPRMKEEHATKTTHGLPKPNEPSGMKLIVGINTKPEASEDTSAAPKLRIKFKNRTLN